jgi:hypothetical protein
MKLLFIWTVFTLFVGVSYAGESMDDQRYVLLLFVMFYATYICNQMAVIQVNSKIYVLLFSIPCTIMQYLVYGCNNFLWIYPTVDLRTFLGKILFWSFWAYCYIILFIICESE